MLAVDDPPVRALALQPAPVALRRADGGGLDADVRGGADSQHAQHDDDERGGEQEDRYADRDVARRRHYHTHGGKKGRGCGGARSRFCSA